MEPSEEIIDIKNVLQLLNLADDKSSTGGSPRANRRGSSVKGSVKKTLESARDLFANLVKNPANEEEKRKSVPVVINCIVKVLTDVVEKVAAQGALIKKALEELKSDKTGRESLLDELKERYEELQVKTKKEQDDLEKDLKQKYEELENKTKQEKVDLEKVLEERSAKLEKEFLNRVELVEINCDEGRQREMKGTLIISSPERSNIHTEAVHKTNFYDETQSWEKESDLDMVLRMVEEKTGVRIPWCDVVACHRIGKRENHSFVLKIGNRQPFSAWETLTIGMKTGKNFNRNNVFINFMLTAKRTEISKQVRQAKKDNLIDKYAIDQNGRVFVKKIGDELRYHEVYSVKDIDQYKKKT